MVFGVTFRAAGYMVLGGFLSAILDDPLLYMLSFANAPNHWWVQGMETAIQTMPIILVVSGGFMLAANAITRKQGTGGI